MIKVDRFLCVSCGTCVRICPFKVLEMREGCPTSLTSKEQGCIKCMHCVSICPTKALSFDTIPIYEEKSILPSSNSYAELKALISSNRSIRKFSDAAVPLHEIKEILKIADFAPSAKNQHPNKWLLVYDSKIVAEIMSLILAQVQENGLPKEILSEYAIGNNVVTLNAPHLLYGIAAKQGVINPYTDTTIALADVDLLFHSKSIGSCWTGYLTRLTNTNPQIRELLGLDDSMQVYGSLAFGYPKDETYERLPYRNGAEIYIL